MGETSGYLVDPKSARAVLEILEDLLDFEVDFDALDERADEMEDVVQKIQQMDGSVAPATTTCAISDKHPPFAAVAHFVRSLAKCAIF